ncbi:hypothetical protein BT63DRAFT_421405 [Microthyrium microscopicum]|uniref:Uncharacterized protein n=1 Tax=Microthyrium microscopicum TaxID=703497 RepID=A0A6A6UNF6_9PEZI|nr:hypothetical protein BT63DRAFT_421405 [Microthyrium microscopicum]
MYSISDLDYKYKNAIGLCRAIQYKRYVDNHLDDGDLSIDCGKFDYVFNGKNPGDVSLTFPFDLNAAKAIRKLVVHLYDGAFEDLISCRCVNAEAGTFCIHDLEFLFPNLKSLAIFTKQHIMQMAFPFYRTDLWLTQLDIDWDVRLQWKIKSSTLIEPTQENHLVIMELLKSSLVELPISRLFSDIQNVYATIFSYKLQLSIMHKSRLRSPFADDGPFKWGKDGCWDKKEFDEFPLAVGNSSYLQGQLKSLYTLLAKYPSEDVAKSELMNQLIPSCKYLTLSYGSNHVAAAQAFTKQLWEVAVNGNDNARIVKGCGGSDICDGALRCSEAIGCGGGINCVGRPRDSYDTEIVHACTDCKDKIQNWSEVKRKMYIIHYV